MDFYYSKEQDRIRQEIRQFCKEAYTKETARVVDDSQQFPKDLWKRAGEKGYLGVSIPKEYGGGGGSVMDLAIVLEELIRGIAPVGFAFVNSSVFGGSTISLFGSEDQKKKLLPGLADGRIIVGLGATEPDCGTDILACKTFASTERDHYLLNGQKTMITLATMADYIITITRTDRGSKTKGISVFLVDTKLPGVEIRPIKKMPSRAVPVGEVFFTDVKVPKDHLIGKFNNGWTQIVRTLDHERIAMGAVCIGFAQAAYDDIVECSKQEFKIIFGQSQVLQHRLVDMYVNIEAARLLVTKAAWLEAANRKDHEKAAMAKLFASEMCVKVTENALKCLGQYGYTMRYDMQRYFRDSRIFTVAPISNEMVKNMLAEGLGFKKSY